MKAVDDKVVPFVIGLALGFWGIRWFMHLAYLLLIVGAFFLGRHVAV